MAEYLRPYKLRVKWSFFILNIVYHSLMLLTFYGMGLAGISIFIVIIGLSLAWTTYNILFRVRIFLEGFENRANGLELHYFSFNKKKVLNIDRASLKIKGIIQLSSSKKKTNIWSTIIIKQKGKRIKIDLPNEDCSRFIINAFKYVPECINKSVLHHIIYERKYLKDETVRQQLELIKLYLEK